MGWTDEQIDAIDTRDVGIIVPAAAGSGKTTVLIERIIKLLADEKLQITPDRLLAVTFTVDATANMKQKLSDEFEKKLDADPDNEWLKKQQSALALAKIRTINAFCYDFVKEYFSRLDIRDDVTILEQEDEDVLFDKAVAQTLEQAYEQKPELMKLLNDSLCQDTDKELEEHISRLNRVLSSVPYPELWAQRTVESFKNGKAFANYTDALFEKILLELTAVRRSLDYLRFISSVLTDVKSLNGVVMSDILILEDFIEQVEKRDADGVRKVCSGIEWLPLGNGISSAVKKTGSQIISEYYHHFKKNRDEYKAVIAAAAEALSNDPAEDKKQLEFVGELFEGLVYLTLEARKLIRDMKLEKNAVSFADVEDMTVRLLLTPTDSGYERTELANDIRDRELYKIILIDEFQDVNDLQELIFKALSDTDDLSIMGKNVFVVGDVKQAIYGFRQANPELFIKASDSARQIENSDKLTEIRLSANFRSRSNVIDLVNFLFSQLMTKTIGDVAYDDKEMLYYHAEYKEAQIPTDVMYFESESRGDGDDDESSGPSEFNNEHIAIANYISDMIKNGHLVKDKNEEGETVYRPCRASDFCVLVRKNRSQACLAKALETAGLRSFSENTDGYLKSREILVMINLLRVIDSPLNDLAMLSVMLSPVFGFTEEDVTEIRLLCSTEKTGIRMKLYQVMLGVSKEEDAHDKETKKIEVSNDALEKKCRYACALIRKLRYYAASMPLESLVKKIYDETDFYSVASAFENSSQMRANLRLLIEYAAAYDSSGGSGLPGFIRYFEKIESLGKDFSQASVTINGGDAVYIKTMHKSKGLEYPFIVLCDLNTTFNVTDLSKSFLCDRSFGAAFKYHNVYNLSCSTNLAYDAISYKLKRKLWSEEMRLLYVALTRAKERICIPIDLRANESAKQFDTYSKLYNSIFQLASKISVSEAMVFDCNTFIEWVMLALVRSRDMTPVIQLINDKMEYYNDKKKKKETFYPIELECYDLGIDLNVFKGDTRVRGAVSSAFDRESADTALVASLMKNIKNTEKLNTRETLAKLSVTEIVKREHELDDEAAGQPSPFYPRLPRLDEEVDDLTHAERGTYTHLFMELADYSKAEQSVEAELERLVSLKLFTPKEASGVYVRALELFFAGDFYKRIRSSLGIMREKKFMVRIDELGLGDNYLDSKDTDAMVQGIADCIFEEEDGYVIVDYKTDRFASIADMDKHNTQLKIYKAAFDLLLDKPVKSCYIYSFWLGTGKEMTF